jgi:general secretion pathway protein H
MTRGTGVRARGFTLVELIVVLFIIALVAAVALPAVGRGVDALQLRAEVATFATFLRYAREQAITRREAQEVTINPDAHLLTLRAAGTEGARARRRLSPRISIRAESPTGLSITFSPGGVSTGGSFRVVGPDGRAYRVSVNPLTGRVSNVRVG